MNEKNKISCPVSIPDEVAHMTPKQIILLMRSLGVGKENFQPPHHARAWTTTEFLDACTRDDVIRRARKCPPERTTVDGWFSPSGPVPDDRRDAWHYFFHVFFSYERRAFGTLAWKIAYFDAVTRAKINAVRRQGTGLAGNLPLEPAPDWPSFSTSIHQKGSK